MINELIKLATHLDNLGYHREANYVDEMLRKNAGLPWLFVLFEILWPADTASNNSCNGPGAHIWEGAGKGGCSWTTVFYKQFWKRESRRDPSSKWIANKQYGDPNHMDARDFPDSLKEILYQSKWEKNANGSCCTPDWLPMQMQADALEAELDAWDELPEPNPNLRLPAMETPGVASPGSADPAPLEYYGPGGQYPTKD
jgi:hypothetical protein